MSRFFSLITSLLLLVLVGSIPMSSGCYPHWGGEAVESDSERLLELADDACERRDRPAFQMLWSRLVSRDPDAARTPPARRLRNRCCPDCPAPAHPEQP